MIFVFTGSVGNSDELVEAEPYRAAAEYVAASDEEVNLQIGDQVDVITKDDSGVHAVLPFITAFDLA